ncbi:zinc transporter ZntB [Rhodobacteraceae bacterium NNCM2]|nr:zinc transporter ZntB [Coraliihabitans acroporae]
MTATEHATDELPDVISYVLDGQGGGYEISPDEVAHFDPSANKGSFAWQHYCRDHPETLRRLRENGLDEFVIDALTAAETRPRCTLHENGVFLNLRGVNLTPGAEPDDMISVRLWIEARRVIGVWLRPLHAVSDLLSAIKRGQAPTSTGDFVAKLALRLADRAEPLIVVLNEQIDEMEEQVLEMDTKDSRSDLAEIRRQSIMLRRYLIPQKDALTTLEIEDLGWLKQHDRSRIREASERVFRLGEELDAIRDRAQVIHDQIMGERAERMNRQMLILSIVAAIFLPLGLITGLLGINVGGIPGAQDPWGFATVCAILVALGAALYLLFRRLGLLR